MNDLRKFLKYLVPVFVWGIVAVSCDKSDFEVPHYANSGSTTGGVREVADNQARTLLVYSAGYNNLSADLRDDIEDICNGYIPDHRSHKANLLIFAHHSGSESATKPCLIRVYRGLGGRVIRDTVKVWGADMRAVSTSTLTEVLNYVKDNYPAKEYGLLVSSHATGWLPSNYSTNRSTSGLASAETSELATAGIEELATAKTVARPQRTVMQDSATKEEMDIKDFAAAIPYHLNYIIFDACLVGGIEVAYELKDVCDRIVFSPSEILADGMVYTNIIQRLLGEDPSNIVGVAEDFYEYYSTYAGYKYGSISVINCSALENLAAVCKGIFADRWSSIMGINPNLVQKTNRAYPYMSSYEYYYYFDFRDIFRQLDLSASEISAVDAALEDCVEYKATTDVIVGGVVMNTFSGLSMYLPSAIPSYLSSLQNRLNEYYLDYSWNKDSGYIVENQDWW